MASPGSSARPLTTTPSPAGSPSSGARQRQRERAKTQRQRRVTVGRGVRVDTATSSRTRKDRPEERKDETQTTNAPRQSIKSQRIRRTTSSCAPKRCALRGSIFAHLRIARAHAYRIARKFWSLFAPRRVITGAFFFSQAGQGSRGNRGRRAWASDRQQKNLREVAPRRSR